MARPAAILRTTLRSGLDVVVAPQPHLHRTHLALYLRVGSRYEAAPESGISHFLEHMLYRGTDTLKTAHDVSAAFERIGSYLYGATHADFGVFSVTVPPTRLGEAARLFAHVMTSPRFRDMALEKGIVGDEILEDLDDDGRQVDADNLSRELIYGAHPLGATITGSPQTLATFTTKALAKHHAEHYTARNAVLVVTGAADESALRSVGRPFAALTEGAARAPEPAPPLANKAKFRFVENASSQTELRVGFRAPGRGAPSRAALDLLMRIVDDGMSTRLYHRICDAQGLCYDVSAGYDGYEDDGVVDFAAGVAHERAKKVTDEILAITRDLATRGPTKAEVERAKERTLWHLAGTLDSPEEMAEQLGLAALDGRVDDPTTRAESAQRITAAEVRRVAREVFAPERLSLVAVGLLSRSEVAALERSVRSYSL